MDENMITSQDHQSPPHRRMKPPETAQPPPAQKCPRCDSSNTKFCYYNNYSLSQPRYFCKACRRYWTHGGTLRNVPIGGGCRKSKRPKTSANPSSSTSEMVRAPAQPQPQSMPGPIRPLNYPGMDPGQGSRTSFYTGGTLLTSLTGMQTLTGLHHPPSASLNAGVVGRYGANMGLLQLQANNNGYFASHQHQGLVGSWTQSFVNRGVRNATGDGGGQAGTSFNANNQWSSVGSSHQQGFNHPRPRPPPPQ